MDNKKNNEYYINKILVDLEFLIKHPNIPWRDIIGLRNHIVHEYGNVDLDIIYDTVKEDIYVIEKLFKSID